MIDRLAILGPNFFGYDRALAAEAERRGCKVWLYPDRPSHSVAAKIVIRLGFKKALLRRIREHQQRILAELRANEVRHVILFNPEVTDAEFCSKLKAIGCTLVIYMWDSLRNKPKFLEILPFARHSFTFERNDAERFGMTFLPLFYEDVFLVPQGQRKELDVYFMGSLHSKRARVIHKVHRLCEANNLRFGADIYVQGRFMYLMRHLINPYCLLLPRRFFRLTPMSKQAIADQFARSVAVLDIPHTHQLGLTSRTFEALASGAKLLTTNTDIRRYADLFDADSVHVLDESHMDAAEIGRWLGKTGGGAATERTRANYGIDTFLTKILDGFTHG